MTTGTDQDQLIKELQHQIDVLETELGNALYELDAERHRTCPECGGYR